MADVARARSRPGARNHRRASGELAGHPGRVGARWGAFVGWAQCVMPAQRDASARLHGQLAGIGKRGIRCIRESGWRRLQPTGIGRRAAGDRARGELQDRTFQSALKSPPNAAPKGDTPNADICRAVSNADDSDLSAIVAAWPTLPEHARTRVLAIIAEHRAHWRATPGALVGRGRLARPRGAMRQRGGTPI